MSVRQPVHCVVRVALDLPLRRLFDYRCADDQQLSSADVGYRVRVPIGQRQRIGIIVAVGVASDLADAELRPVLEVLRDQHPLPDAWFRLTRFCASYYQAPLGQVMLATLPGRLRALAASRTLVRRRPVHDRAPAPPPTLTTGQQMALDTVIADGAGFHAYLLHGVTGSGKTEVYLRLIERALTAGRQALVLVPEINLTPQLEARVAERFPDAGLVSLHSDLAEAARSRNWQAACSGTARIVLGTRLAVFTPLPELGLIIVDEEHDSSFKQQDGVRYSARDLAVFRARDGDVPIVLGSATPSLESWANAAGNDGRGRYRLLSLQQRAVEGARLPLVRIIDTRVEKTQDGLSGPLLLAIEQRLGRGEQSLVFLNRRGYAPAMSCPACGWVSGCRRCAANLVLHLADRCLCCHHCGYQTRLPRQCPSCGNQDLRALGRGTQRLEMILAERFPQARLLRVDRDSAGSRKQWAELLRRIHEGEADILVGTQMLAKGHDFPNLTLVGAVAPDAALFAADWRAPERLFAQLMQVAGRAGRAERSGEVLLQTEFPDHPLYQALRRHDYPGFAAAQLSERRQAGFPPYAYQAMLRAEAPRMADAIAFLAAARDCAAATAPAELSFYDAVPMRLSRRASMERGQLLVESPSRRVLQTFLTDWVTQIEALRVPSRLRWHLEVDPLDL
ncbi:MAG TPA: primosomal protein N' [Candidatus Accumulibacter phosphatis]|mgnify:CR=1 FL=1|nr:MAG: Primosomal protein N' [Candidatus Accumulibacter sp. SK-11]HAY26579.1 primosomal protein N' [Accumulibacter sp.]HCN68000.1 primosomal protein N' [Accumulibacter sp.]HRL75071.1 primosomal protein N' [Candidatus Accumulibacter phosphatis]HRQ93842.1 primosomal protein N' [Candidatus Accumulibacter phosphatis]